MPEMRPKGLLGTILLVDTRLAALRRTGELLQRAGHDVIETASFNDAKRLLAAYRPALLISSLRLGAFNGLHLVHLGRFAQPDLNAVIIAAGSDAVLQSETERVGASLLVEPVPIPALLSLIGRMLGTEASPVADESRRERRRSDRRRLLTSGSASERRVGERRTEVLEGPKQLEPSPAETRRTLL
jgi:DNA-binding NtrC family response regulator